MNRLHDKKWEIGRRMLENNVRFAPHEPSDLPKYSRDIKPGWLNEGLNRRKRIQLVVTLVFTLIGLLTYYATIKGLVGPEIIH